MPDVLWALEPFRHNASQHLERKRCPVVTCGYSMDLCCLEQAYATAVLLYESVTAYVICCTVCMYCMKMISILR